MSLFIILHFIPERKGQTSFSARKRVRAYAELMNWATLSDGCNLRPGKWLYAAVVTIYDDPHSFRVALRCGYTCRVGQQTALVLFGVTNRLCIGAFLPIALWQLKKACPPTVDCASRNVAELSDLQAAQVKRSGMALGNPFPPLGGPSPAAGAPALFSLRTASAPFPGEGGGRRSGPPAPGCETAGFMVE